MILCFANASSLLGIPRGQSWVPSCLLACPQRVPERKIAESGGKENGNIKLKPAVYGPTFVDAVFPNLPDIRLKDPFEIKLSTVHLASACTDVRPWVALSSAGHCTTICGEPCRQQYFLSSAQKPKPGTFAFRV